MVTHEDGEHPLHSSLPRGIGDVAAWIREQEVGREIRIETPFGRRLIYYADLTATGRHLRAVEDWLTGVRPFYANTHTEISTTGRMMTRLREEARRVVRRAVNAADDDEVIFVGSGATAAVNKLVGLLGLRVPEPLERAYGLSRVIPEAERPVVFVGPYEHHSNELPWLESIAEVIEIGLDERGAINLGELRQRLEAFADRRIKIGSFSAASNVTGILTEVDSIARVLHRAGALAFFDYAAAAPYVPIDMHPADPEGRIDALFLSPHKFVGGAEASGVLVAHRSLFWTQVPERPGGGTVSYVAGPSREAVDYFERLSVREEGGTPAILGDVRAAMGFIVKDMAGAQAILDHETALAARAAQRLERHPRIQVLGPRHLPRLAIVPIEIEGLHHDFVSILLDHLFGIQNRAGCSCAGPYGHRLLGIDPSRSSSFRALVKRGLEGMKPGWARLSLPWYASEEDLDFVLTAVEFVASHGEEFVPLYRFGWQDGVWDPIDWTPPPGSSPRLILQELGEPKTEREMTEPMPDEALQAERRGYLAEAQKLADELRGRWKSSSPTWNPPTGDGELDSLVWFKYVHAKPLDGGC